MDETILDKYRKILLHPLLMTFIILNWSTSNLSMSWSTLSYIPNFDDLFSNKNYLVDFFCYLLSRVEKMLSFLKVFIGSLNSSLFLKKLQKKYKVCVS